MIKVRALFNAVRNDSRITFADEIRAITEDTSTAIEKNESKQ